MRAGRRIAAATALAGLVLVPACSSKPAPQVSGVIVEKDHDRGTCNSATTKLSSFESRPGGGGGGGGGRGGSAGGGAKPAPRPAAPKPAPKPPVVPAPAPTAKKPSCKAEEWEFDIRTADNDVVEIDVSRVEFDRYRVGDRYPR